MDPGGIIARPMRAAGPRQGANSAPVGNRAAAKVRSRAAGAGVAAATEVAIPRHAHSRSPLFAATAWHADALLLSACVLIASLAAFWLRQDANWDLLNYHFYDPWAWLRGRTFDWDIAAAQLQTYHNPFADVPFYLLIAANVQPRVITIWLALPTAIAGYFSTKIAWRLFADLGAAERVGATFAATAIGFTGAMGVGQLGTTTGEWLITAFTLASLWLLLQAGIVPGPSRADRLLVSAGVLMGIASGLKLTGATYAVGLCVALVVGRARLPRKVRAALLYSVGVVAGMLVAFGPWSYTLWEHFGNPVFPYANQYFRSPWWELRSVLSRDFGPHTAGEWLLLPFKLLAPPRGFVSEVSYVDPRLPVLYALALVAAGGRMLAHFTRTAVSGLPAFRTTSEHWKFIGVAFGASFAVWAVLHSILRYTIPIEILSGLLIVGLLGYLLRPRDATAAVTLAVVGVVVATVWSDWGRVDFGRTWFDVHVPRIERNPLVLLTADAPMSYVLPFFPQDARYVGVRNNLNKPNRDNRLAQSVSDVIRGHAGPLYALSYPANQGDADLAAYGLRRIPGDCADVKTNMPVSPIQLCRLERVDSAD